MNIIFILNKNREVFMKQRKSFLPKILLTLVIVAVLGFMIWWLVDLNKPKAIQLTLGNAVNEDGEISLRIENRRS